MKKTLFLTLALTVMVNMLFGAYLIYETFDSGVPPTGWTLGPNTTEHGYIWNWGAITGAPGSPGASSRSRYTGTSPGPFELHPNHWLITCQLDLNAGDNAPKTLQFNYLQNGPTANEHITVYISTAGNLPADFLGENGSILWDYQLLPSETGVTWFLKEIDLSDYTGEVYVAFRHHESVNGGTLAIDDVRVYFPLDYDLEMSSISSNTTSLDLDITADGVTITGVIRNDGQESASGYTVNLYRYGSNSPIYSWDDGIEIAPNNTRTLTHQYVPPVGTAVLYMVIDYEDDMYTINNTSNNISIQVIHGNTSLKQPIGGNTNNAGGNYSGVNPSSYANAPMHFYFYESFSQSLYLREGAGSANNQPMELGTSPLTITSLAWSYTQAAQPAGFPVRIYLGHTELSSFPGGGNNNTNWVPLAGQQLVYNGTLPTLPNTATADGVDLWFPFIEPFEFNGEDNLVVSVFTGDGSFQYAGASGTQWWRVKTLTGQQGGQNRTLYRLEDDEDEIYNDSNLYTLGGSRANQVPVIKFGLASGTTVSLFGIVTDDEDNPIGGVTVGRLDNPSVTVLTNADGEYEFTNFNTTNDGIFATKAGYPVFNSEPLTEDNVTVIDTDTWQFDFFMPPLPSFTVSGIVKSAYNATGLQGVTLDFNHPQGRLFRVISGPGGAFAIDLPQNATYTLSTLHPHYVAYNGAVAVETSPVTIPDIMLIEKGLQPLTLKATDIPQVGKVVTWRSPFTTPTNTFTYAPSSGATGSIGISGNPFTAFARFSIADMIAELTDWGTPKIYRVAFRPGVSPEIATYTITIMHYAQEMSVPPTADYPAYNADAIIYQQPVLDYQIDLEHWVYVDLNNLVDFSTYTAGQLWVGIAITSPGTTYPMVAATTGANTYRGDIYYLPGQNGYNQLGTQNFGNWLIAAYALDDSIVPTTTRSQPVVSIFSHAKTTSNFGTITDHLVSSIHSYTELEPLLTPPIYNPLTRNGGTRAFTRYELYRVPLANYGTPVNTWGTPIYTGSETDYPDNLAGAPTTEWLYGLIAVYNQGDATYEIITEPIYSVVLVTSPTFAVSGTVVDANNAGITGVTVALVNTDPEGASPATAVTDTNGGFTIYAESGVFELTLSLQDYPPYTHTEQITVEDSAINLGNITYILNVTTYTISGFVYGEMVDMPGPIIGATVKLGLLDPDMPTVPIEVTSADGGLFTFTDVPPGEYGLEVSMEGYNHYVHPTNIVVTDSDITDLIIDLGPRGIADEVIIPTTTALKTNYPNPFNPSTTIAYDLAKADNVVIEIYNIKGQRIKTLANGTFNAGSYRIVWNGDDQHGRNVGSGVYFYRMTTSEYNNVRKMLLMK